MVITIDGPAGSGKSTAARELARVLGISCLDTGATYRAVTLKALQDGADLEDEDQLARLAREADIELRNGPEGLRTFLDGRDVSHAIRSERVSENSYYVARSGKVRSVLVDLQRRIGAAMGSFVTEGRDQGSVVFPDADVKFYLDASVEVRARRRFDEMQAAGEQVEYDHVLEAIRQRDGRDRGRAVAPLTKPDDAVEIDTSEMDIREVTAELVRQVEARA